MWNGEFFQRMNVYVDLAPAVESNCCLIIDESDDKLHELTEPPPPLKLPPLGVNPRGAILIPKISRHDEAHQSIHFHVSHSSTEQAVIAALPLNIKHGLILAKAVRIASIARPAEDLTSHYGLQEDIHVDDFITSYLLKTCLMKLLPRHSQAESCNCRGEHATECCEWTTAERDNACSWAIRIYEKLKKDLAEKGIAEWYYRYKHTLIDCRDCKVERGCCKKMKLTLAMTSQILDWLKRHQQQLSKLNRRG